MWRSTGETDGSIMPVIMTAHMPNRPSQLAAPQIRVSIISMVSIRTSDPVVAVLALMLTRYSHASAVMSVTQTAVKARSRRIVSSSAEIIWLADCITA